MLRAKICCIATESEAALAVREGASAIGLVSAMPSGPGPIPEEQIRAIARTVPPGVDTFLLTSSRDPREIERQARVTGVRTLQLVDAQATETYPELRNSLPGARLVQVIHVTGPDALGEAQRIASFVDALLLDSGNPSAAVKELGGTGRTHDWTISTRIRERVGVPVFLAGGLTPENVAEAVRRVRPYAVDVCSGLRTDGRLDERKLRAFMVASGIATR